MSSYRSRRRRIQKEVSGLLLSINEQHRSADSLSSSISCIGDRSSSFTTVNTSKSFQSSDNKLCLDLDLDLDIDVENHSDKQSESENNDPPKLLKQQLATWAIIHSVPHNALSELLKILQEHVSEKVPLCSKTLLQTPRKLNVHHIPGGKYFYFGLKAYLHKIVQNNLVNNFKFPKQQETNNFLSLSLSTDGVPICKSTNLSMWPILVMVDQAKTMALLWLLCILVKLNQHL